MKERFSVLISNHHPESWPYRSKAVEVGGLGVKEARPLTGDLRTFLDSAIPPGQMPAVFRPLHQFCLVWKWDGEIENLQDNVRTCWA